MGTLRAVSWGVMDVLVAEFGESGVLDSICGRIAEGESPADIARSHGVLPMVIRKWLEADGKRLEMVELAKRCYADKLAWEAIGRIGAAEVETVGLEKFRFDAGMKVAGKLDRRSWGDEKDVDKGGGLTVVVQRGGVVRIGSGKDLGYPVQQGVIEGEIVEGETI